MCDHRFAPDGPQLRCVDCGVIGYWRNNGWRKLATAMRCKCGVEAIKRDHERRRNWCAACLEAKCT